MARFISSIYGATHITHEMYGRSIKYGDPVYYKKKKRKRRGETVRPKDKEALALFMAEHPTGIEETLDWLLRRIIGNRLLPAGTLTCCASGSKPSGSRTKNSSVPAN